MRLCKLRHNFLTKQAATAYDSHTPMTFFLCVSKNMFKVRLRFEAHEQKRIFEF